MAKGLVRVYRTIVSAEMARLGIFITVMPRLSKSEVPAIA